MKKHSVLLVDDDAASNFLHKRLLLSSELVDQVDICLNGRAALEYLTSPDSEGKLPKPDLILLDINMPVMNGWDFLEEYEKVSKQHQDGILIVMLTTSLNPDDREKAENMELVDAFVPKPLTVEEVIAVMENLDG